MAEWELLTAMDVAEALDWLRRRMKGDGLVLVAIGPNAIAYCKDARLPPEEAVEMIFANLEAVRGGLERLETAGRTRGAVLREDAE